MREDLGSLLKQTFQVTAIDVQLWVTTLQSLSGVKSGEVHLGRRRRVPLPLKAPPCSPIGELAQTNKTKVSGAKGLCKSCTCASLRYN